MENNNTQENLNNNANINDTKIGVLSGNFYNEEAMILEKYKELKKSICEEGMAPLS